MMLSLLALCLGCALDLLLGDPHWMPHPVRLIGGLIEKTERLVRSHCSEEPASLRRGGVITALVVLVISTLTPLLLLLAAQRISPWLRFALETLMCYQILAARSLHDESMKVCRALRDGDLAKARRAVSMIVGRDTDALTEEGVAKAAVETVAENTSDGVVAPLLFLALGGPVLGFGYKAVNTMDSMLGYKNDRYLHFGRFAAKLDDAVNFVPARLAAWAMIASAYLLGFDGKNAQKIYRRDRRNHASPNSAQTESVCAGALRVQLAGDAYYFGKLCKKPTIGDSLGAVSCEMIPAANRLMFGAALLTLAGGVLFRLAAMAIVALF